MSADEPVPVKQGRYNQVFTQGLTLFHMGSAQFCLGPGNFDNMGQGQTTPVSTRRHRRQKLSSLKDLWLFWTAQSKDRESDRVSNILPFKPRQDWSADEPAA